MFPHVILDFIVLTINGEEYKITNYEVPLSDFSQPHPKVLPSLVQIFF
jgi:hypothetical protein